MARIQGLILFALLFQASLMAVIARNLYLNPKILRITLSGHNDCEKLKEKSRSNNEILPPSELFGIAMKEIKNWKPLPLKTYKPYEPCKKPAENIDANESNEETTVAAIVEITTENYLAHEKTTESTENFMETSTNSGLKVYTSKTIETTTTEATDATTTIAIEDQTTTEAANIDTTTVETSTIGITEAFETTTLSANTFTAATTDSADIVTTTTGYEEPTTSKNLNLDIRFNNNTDASTTEPITTELSTTEPSTTESLENLYETSTLNGIEDYKTTALPLTEALATTVWPFETITANPTTAATNNFETTTFEFFLETSTLPAESFSTKMVPETTMNAADADDSTTAETELELQTSTLPTTTHQQQFENLETTTSKFVLEEKSTRSPIETTTISFEDEATEIFWSKFNSNIDKTSFKAPSTQPFVATTTEISTFDNVSTTPQAKESELTTETLLESTTLANTFNVSTTPDLITPVVRRKHVTYASDTMPNLEDFL